MKQKDTEEKRGKKVVTLYIITLLVLLFTSVAGLVAIGLITWHNADKAGSDLANSYCLAEEHNFNNYRNLLDVGAGYIDEMLEIGIDNHFLEERLVKYFSDVKAVNGIDKIEPYAIVADKLILAETQWEQGKPDAGAVKKQKWYQNALKAEGEVVVTDAYVDIVYDKPVITFARKCNNSDNVIAIDMFREDFGEWMEQQTLPEGSICYVFDSKGMLFYVQADHELEGFNEEYLGSLFQKVKEQEGSTDPVYIKDQQGKKQNVYYRKNTNGGYCILTIPHQLLLMAYGKAYISYVIVFLITISTITYVWVKGAQERKAGERVLETVQVLGSSYYALYRIHLKEARYEIIKGGELLGEDFPRQGNYEDLLQKIHSFIHKDALEDFAESFSLENIHRQIEKNIRDFGGDFQRNFNGEYQWVNVRMLYEPSFSKNEVVLCFHDAEEEKQRQLRYMDTLKEALEAAKVSENSQKQFFSRMSHDMRTPLNGIIGISEIAVNYVQEPEKMKDYLEKIHFSSKQLLALINDILEISRLEQGIVLNQELFNFRESMEACLNVFQIQAEAAGKNFKQTYEISKEMVYGDSMRVSQVLNNLVSNALKFTEQGDSITVAVRQLGDAKFIRYQIVVQDTGAGMSEEFLSRLFEPYAREARFGSIVEGTGLGMPIVKSIVSQMGGEIGVESVLKQGTTFTITLPFEAAQDIPEENKAEKSTSTGYTLQDKKILLAEDYELNMEIATEILEMEGAVVVPAWNGREALERFKESEEYSFSAILMDMQMPKMDGCEATREIRALDRLDARSIPIIALTANAFAENIASTLKAGMNAHIVKPIDVDLLCTTLGRLIAEEEEKDKQKGIDGMGVKECYEKMQADYDSVFSRLRSEERIQKFLNRFLEDSNYEKLSKALKDNEYQTAFMAVHNLKGLSQNLSFTLLERSTSELCEALRDGKVPAEEKLAVLTEKVRQDYEKTKEAVEQM